MDTRRVYTIGHSTRLLGALIEALRAHSIQTLVDIRAFSRSRRLPQFNSESLGQSLPEAGIRYTWMPELGGYRKKTRDDSPNIALRNESFRNYADYMLTPEFKKAMRDLVGLAQSSRTAYMCAEREFTRCHRRLVSDWLLARGHEVMHIDTAQPTRAHTLSAEARIDGELIYKGDRLL